MVHTVDQCSSAMAGACRRAAQYRHPALDEFFKYTSACADEMFYMLALPLPMWHGDRARPRSPSPPFSSVPWLPPPTSPRQKCDFNRISVLLSLKSPQPRWYPRTLRSSGIGRELFSIIPRATDGGNKDGSDLH